MGTEFPELEQVRLSGCQATLLEAGCGVGNSVFPLLDSIPSLRVFAGDFAATAIHLLKSSQSYRDHAGRCHAFVCDLSSDDGGAVLQQNVLGGRAAAALAAGDGGGERKTADAAAAAALRRRWRLALRGRGASR